MSYLVVLHAVGGEEEVEAVGDDEGTCSLLSLEAPVEGGNGGAKSLFIMGLIPGDREGEGVGVEVGVGVDVGAVAEEDLWDRRPFMSGLIPESKSTISPVK